MVEFDPEKAFGPVRPYPLAPEPPTPEEMSASDPWRAYDPFMGVPLNPWWLEFDRQLDERCLSIGMREKTKGKQ